MASLRSRSKSLDKKRVEYRLVDTHTEATHSLEEGGRLLIVSHAHLENLEGYDHAHRTLQLAPSFDRDVYCVEILIQAGRSSGLVCVHRGVCYVNGEQMRDGAKPRRMKSGTFLDLGASHQFQFVTFKVSDDLPTKRVLPQTPGQLTNEMPPSKPPRQHVPRAGGQESTDSGSYASSSYTGSIDVKRSAIDEGLRAALKRIAKEIESRKSGYQDRKPPPPYEQAGNSIGYQLLHHKHSDITTGLLNGLYPALKELEMKDADLSNDYSSFVTKYDEAREAGATPQCMLPGDIPTINFIADVVVNLCCMPQMVSLSEKYAPFFAHLLAIFSSTHQNQVAMAEQRHTTKILSCMNLTIMANNVIFQQHGWTLLANTLAIPTLTGKKPLLSEASLTLALGLIESQLSDYSLELALSLSIIRFLAVVASTAKQCTLTDGKGETPPIYTPTQASGIIKLLNETKILRHVMKVPQGIRSDPAFDQHYAVVVKCLAPTRSKRKGIISRRVTTSDLLEAPPLATTPPSSNSPTVPSTVPPPKPKRRFRNRRSTLGTQSNGISDIASKVMMKTVCSDEKYLSSSLTVGNGHVISSNDHMISSETRDEDADMKSVSEVSTELKSLSCSALPEERRNDEDLPQCTSAPQLPQGKSEAILEEHVLPEPAQAVKKESLTEEPVKQELTQQEDVKYEATKESEEMSVQPEKQDTPVQPVVKIDVADIPEELVQPELQGEDPTKSESTEEEASKEEEGEEPAKQEVEQVQGDQAGDSVKEKDDKKLDELPGHEEHMLRDELELPEERESKDDTSELPQSELDESVMPEQLLAQLGEERLAQLGEERVHGEGKECSELIEHGDMAEKGEKCVTSIKADATDSSSEVARPEERSISDELLKVEEEEEIRDRLSEREDLTQETIHQASIPSITEESKEICDVTRSTKSDDIAPKDGLVRSSERREEEIASNGAMAEQSEDTRKDTNECFDHDASLHDDSSGKELVGGRERELTLSGLASDSPHAERKPHLLPVETHPLVEEMVPSVTLDSPSLAEGTALSVEEPHPSLDEPRPFDDELPPSPSAQTEGESLEQPHPSTNEPCPPQEHPLPTTAHVQDNSSSEQLSVGEDEVAITSSSTLLDTLQVLSSLTAQDDNLPSKESEHSKMAADDIMEGERTNQEPAVEEPWSPGATALANDIESLLSVVQAPLGEEQVVKVPSISRHSRYYRVSVKSSTPKSSRRGQDGEDYTTPKGEESPSYRTKWDVATPPSAVHGYAEASPFEVSGEFLSTTHQAIEEIMSGHQDMKGTLEGRLEVASGVLGLWRRNKGLQASTNLVQACFSSGRDMALFVDIIQHFLSHQPPWTLAVCFVLLPVLRQLLTTQTDERCLSVVCDVLHMIINRFSELILFSKGKSRAHRSRRLSSTIDREQQEVCYNELHDIRQSLHHRLDVNSDPTTVANCLRKVHAALKPFKDPLDDVRV